MPLCTLLTLYSTYSYSAYLSSVHFHFAHFYSVSTFTRLTHSSSYLSLCSFFPVHFFSAYSGPTFTLCPALTLCSLSFCSHSHFAPLSLLTFFVYFFLTSHLAHFYSAHSFSAHSFSFYFYSAYSHKQTNSCIFFKCKHFLNVNTFLILLYKFYIFAALLPWRTSLR